MMPEMDGYEVCQHIRSNPKTKDTPIIFLTAKVEKESIVKGLKTGAQDYLSKPFNAEELLARVKTHLELGDKRKQLSQVNQLLEEKVKERTQQLQKAYNDLEEAKNKLEHLEKAKSDFLGLISHELRTPLNGILGFAGILKESITEPENQEFLGYLLESADRLLQFSDSALIVAQLSVDRYQLAFEKNSLKNIFELAVERLDDTMQKKAISLDCNWPKTDVVCECDSELLVIAFGNVLKNAVEHSPENERIHVSVQMQDDTIQLLVADKGKGFSEEALQNLFQFFSANEIIHHSQGFGLGLSTAKLIMEAHGGDVKVENKEEKGARVIFEFRN